MWATKFHTRNCRKQHSFIKIRNQQRGWAVVTDMRALMTWRLQLHIACGWLNTVKTCGRVHPYSSDLQKKLFRKNDGIRWLLSSFSGTQIGGIVPACSNDMMINFEKYTKRVKIGRVSLSCWLDQNYQIQTVRGHNREFCDVGWIHVMTSNILTSNTPLPALHTFHIPNFPPHKTHHLPQKMRPPPKKTLRLNTGWRIVTQIGYVIRSKYIANYRERLTNCGVSRDGRIR